MYQLVRVMIQKKDKSRRRIKRKFKRKVKNIKIKQNRIQIKSKKKVERKELKDRDNHNQEINMNIGSKKIDRKIGVEEILVLTRTMVKENTNKFVERTKIICFRQAKESRV